MVTNGGASVVGTCGELFGIPELALSLRTAVLEAEISALNGVAWAYKLANIHREYRILHLVI